MKKQLLSFFKLILLIILMVTGFAGCSDAGDDDAVPSDTTPPGALTITEITATEHHIIISWKNLTVISIML
jgi:hypothetical protein